MELTAAEQELIRIKREQDLLQEQQDALQSQLEYDANLRKQSEQIEIKRKQLTDKYERTIGLYNKLCSLGVKEYVSKREYKANIEIYEHITRGLKPEDVIKEDSNAEFIKITADEWKEWESNRLKYIDIKDRPRYYAESKITVKMVKL